MIERPSARIHNHVCQRDGSPAGVTPRRLILSHSACASVRAAAVTNDARPERCCLLLLSNVPAARLSSPEPSEAATLPRHLSVAAQRMLANFLRLVHKLGGCLLCTGHRSPT